MSTASTTVHLTLLTYTFGRLWSHNVWQSSSQTIMLGKKARRACWRQFRNFILSWENYQSLTILLPASLEDHYAHRYEPTLPYPDLLANQFCTSAQSFHLQLAYFAKLIYKTSLVVSDIQFSSISKQCFYFEWCNYYQIYQLAIYSTT